ncbi:MAG: hypothetical protein Q9162_005857 [Coniocarpon cinnabarinum]
MVFQKLLDKFKKHEPDRQPEPEFLVDFDDDYGLSRVELEVEAPPGSQVPPEGWEELFKLVMEQLHVHNAKSKVEGSKYTMEARRSNMEEWKELKAALEKAGMTQPRSLIDLWRGQGEQSPQRRFHLFQINLQAATETNMPFKNLSNKWKTRTGHDEKKFTVVFLDNIQRVEFHVEVPKGSEEPPEEWLQLIDQLAAHFNLTTPLPLGWARHYKRCSILQESSKEAELIEALKKAGVRRKWREKNTYTSTGERARKDLETQLNAARGSGNGKE